MEERILGAEVNIVNIDKTAREDAKTKKLLTQNVQEIQETVRRPNLRIIGIKWLRISTKRHSKYLQQNCRKKLPYP